MSYVGKVKIGQSGSPVLVGSTLYGTCASTAATVAKVATVAGLDTLFAGLTIAIKFDASNTATNPTLNVSSTGAKGIRINSSTPVGKTPQSSWTAGSVVLLTYDGTYWIMDGGVGLSATDYSNLVAKDTSLQTAINEINNTTIPGINTAVNGKEPKLLRFKDKVATFTSGNGITNFGYRATVTCSGVTANMAAHVCFSGNDAGSGDFAPYCQTGSGVVYLYAAAAKSNVTIPLITCWSKT